MFILYCNPFNKDLMKIHLSPDLISKIPGIRVAAIVLKNVKNERKSSNVSQLLRGVCAQRKLQLKNDEKKKEIMSVLNNGKVGEKLLPEVQLLESKIRRIANSRDIQHQNNIEGILNYLGVKYLVPVYGCDLDQTEKDITLELIKPKQGKHPDDFSFSPETRHIAVWLIDIGSMDKEQFSAQPKEFSKIIQKYCSGLEDNIFILDADSREADLGYTSEKEIAYKEEQLKKLQSAEDPETGLPGFLGPSAAAKIKPEPLLKEKIYDLLRRSAHEYLNTQQSYREELLDQLDIQTPNDPTHGDYACSIAMKLARELQKSPLEIAEAIIQLIPKNDLIDKAETAGPGFINIYVSPSFLIGQLDSIRSYGENYGRLTVGTDKVVAIEYSSPNIAKPLGVHHLLSTIIGQILTNLFRFAGYKVVALNWPGDWGTQFGKLVYAYKTWGNEEIVLKDPLNELLKLYVKFHDKAEKDPALEDKGREEFKKLEEGDEENLKLWSWMKEISIRELERIYQKLDVHFDEYLGEYMYLDRAREMIREGIEKGIITEGEKGAMVVKFEEDKYPPYIMQKGDGTTIYASRDLASIKDRVERLKASGLIYVVDVAQSLHFNQLFETARKFGFTSQEFKHVVFGRMQLPEGKMSTRKGEIILLDEVLKEATSRARTLVEEKSKDLLPEEKARIAEEMAVSAIKYHIISQNRETNITFDLDRMLSLEGNSAPYLEYTLARANSIIRKHGEETAAKKAPQLPLVKNDLQTDLFSITEAKLLEESLPAKDSSSEKPFSNPAEIALIKLLPHFPEAIEHSVKEYKPNLAAAYLYELARAFNSFYDKVSVLSAGSPELKESRIKIVQAVAQVLRNGLNVLGMAVFEKM